MSPPAPQGLWSFMGLLQSQRNLGVVGGTWVWGSNTARFEYLSATNQADRFALLSLSLLLCKMGPLGGQKQCRCDAASFLPEPGQEGSSATPAWGSDAGASLGGTHSKEALWTPAGILRPWPARGSSSTAQSPVEASVGRTLPGHPTIKQVGGFLCSPPFCPSWDWTGWVHLAPMPSGPERERKPELPESQLPADFSSPQGL